MAVVDDHCQSSGRDPATIRRTVNVIFALTKDGTSSYDVIARQGWGAREPMVREGAISGPPDAAVEQIQRYIDAGAEGVNVALRGPGMTVSSTSTWSSCPCCVRCRDRALVATVSPSSSSGTFDSRPTGWVSLNLT